MQIFAKIQEWMDRTVFNNTLLEWTVAVGISLLVFVLLKFAKWIAVRRTRRLTKLYANDWSKMALDIANRTRSLLLFVFAIYVGSQVLDLPARVERILNAVTIIGLLVQIAIWVNSIMTTLLTRYVNQRMQTDAASVTTIAAVGFFLKLGLWVIVALLSLENLGIDVTALVAGLGIGGIAVALAAQSILGDLFSSLSIVLDKPFVLGDFITVDTQTGTVEKIGLKTTRLRSLSGEQLVFSNTDLLKSRIQNFKRMQQRRVVFSIGVTYDTPIEQLTAIPARLKEIISTQSPVRFDRAHLKEFGDSSINFEIVYLVLSSDYNVYMDIQQTINLEIHRWFTDEKINFAFPSRTIYTVDANKTPEESPAEKPERQ